LSENRTPACRKAGLINLETDLIVYYMKQKTHKALSKRVKITKTGKILKRKGGQDHFNSRESGKVVKNKRRDDQLSSTHRKAVKSLLPHHRIK